MIFLNAERFIAEAIDSVLGQTYPAWELLLVDDGSTDGSPEIASAYVAADPRISYLHHPNRQNLGTGPSRNLGVAKAAGEHVAFLDADDVWLPRKLDEQLALLEGNPGAAMIYGVSQFWYSWTGQAEDLERDHVVSLGLPSGSVLPPTELISRLFLEQRAAVPSICSILVPRGSLPTSEWFPPQFDGPYEDQALYVRLVLTGPVIGYDHCWDRYRQHGTSLTAMIDEAGQGYAARLEFIRWLGRCLAHHDLQSISLRLRLWREQLRCYLGLRRSRRTDGASPARGYPGAGSRR